VHIISIATASFSEQRVAVKLGFKLEVINIVEGRALLIFSAISGRSNLGEFKFLQVVFNLSNVGLKTCCLVS
jgi:hypothetical protein